MNHFVTYEFWCYILTYVNIANPPANVEIVNTGTVAYFPPRHTIDKVDGDKLFVNFGNVKNAAKSDATNVTLDLTFNLVSFAATMASGDLKAKIGGQDATLPGFTSVEPVSVKT